FSFGKFLNVYG
ncbi:hypothetical protein N499_0060B, partial [Wolbachia pipientis wVitA]